MNNPRIENQNPNNTATTEINPTNKNSNNNIPSGHKQDKNNIFSTVTRENSNPDQSPDMCNKQVCLKHLKEMSLPSTTGGAPPIIAQIYEIEEISGEEKDPNKQVSWWTDVPTPMVTVQLTVFKSEQVYLNAEVFSINADYHTS